MKERGMRVEIIRARNLREALSKIKKLFGEDAQIISQEKDPEGVKIKVAVPEEPVRPAQKLKSDGGSPLELSDDGDFSYRDSLIIKPKSPSFLNERSSRNDVRSFEKVSNMDVSEVVSELLSIRSTLEMMLRHLSSKGLIDLSAASVTFPETQDKFLSGTELLQKNPGRHLLHADSRGPGMHFPSGFYQEAQNERFSSFSPVEVAREILLKAGVDPEKASQVVSSMSISSMDSVSAIKDALKERIRRLIKATPGLPMDAKRIYTFVGPTGVGKTTTLVKIATIARLRDRRRVAFITLDFYKLGAKEQLGAFASILRVPMEFVTTPEEFVEKLSLLEESDYDIIFVDTAGKSALDDYSIGELSSFIERVPRSRNILVLPAGYTYHYMVRAVENFSEAIPISSVILSKVDEAPVVGHVLNLVMDYPSLSFSYITTGQSVPEDIEEATPYRMASLIIEGYRESLKYGGKKWR